MSTQGLEKICQENDRVMLDNFIEACSLVNKLTMTGPKMKSLITAENEILIPAAKAGNLDFVRLCLETEKPEVKRYVVQNAYEYAAGAGHLHIVEYLAGFEKKYFFDDDGEFPVIFSHRRAAHSAASHGHIPVLEWFCLQVRGGLTQEHVGDIALSAGAERGHFGCMEWGWSLGSRGLTRGFVTPERYIDSAVSASILKGRKDVLQWLLDRNALDDEAVRHGSYSTGAGYNARYYATQEVRLDTYKWLKEQFSLSVQRSDQ